MPLASTSSRRLRVVNISNTDSRYASGTPGPSSVTENLTQTAPVEPVKLRAATVMMPCGRS